MSDALDEDLLQRIDARGTTPGRRHASDTPVHIVTLCRARSSPIRRQVESSPAVLRDLPFRLGPGVHGRSRTSSPGSVDDRREAARSELPTAHRRSDRPGCPGSHHPEARDTVGLEDDDIHGEDWSACQAVGHAAWFLHMQGILVPAAGGVGLVITAYEQRTRPGQLQVSHSEDLTPPATKNYGTNDRRTCLTESPVAA